MNKIIIDPHYCTEEEYQEIKDYLTEKSWDWQEISSGAEELDSGNHSDQPTRQKMKQYHCRPEGDHKQRQADCDSCDCEHSDGCGKGYEYWHTHLNEKVD